MTGFVGSAQRGWPETALTEAAAPFLAPRPTPLLELTPGPGRRRGGRRDFRRSCWRGPGIPRSKCCGMARRKKAASLRERRPGAARATAKRERPAPCTFMLAMSSAWVGLPSGPKLAGNGTAPPRRRNAEIGIGEDSRKAATTRTAPAASGHWRGRGYRCAQAPFRATPGRRDAAGAGNWERKKTYTTQHIHTHAQLLRVASRHKKKNRGCARRLRQARRRHPRARAPQLHEVRSSHPCPQCSSRYPGRHLQDMHA